MLGAMHIGLTMFVTDQSIAPHELALEAEARGFESLWLPEHTHIPASRKTPYPAGGDLPEEYWRTLDPFGALCAAAAVTKKIKLATGICLVIERDTITTAKEVATLDHLSGGRFLFGIGGGWNVEEMEHHGTEYKTRFKKMREQVLAMREIWTKHEAEFHGELVKFDALWSYPKPIQRPGPPVILGGLSTHTIARVIEYGDGWLPIDPGIGPDMMRPVLQEFDQQLAQSSRKRSEVSVSVYGVAPRAETLDKYRQLGIDRAVFRMRPETRDVVLPKLDSLAKLL
jgi:probable F420-dependent oxidoreductase